MAGEVRVYLLDIREWTEAADGERQMQLAAGKLDSARRKKLCSIRQRLARAQSLGAGLLLQKAAQDYEMSAEGQAAGYGGQPSAEGQAAGYDGQPAVEGQPPGCVTVRMRASQLVSLLGQGRELDYRYSDHGKPYLEGNPFFFSLSHSGDYVLCAVSDREIGADIQKTDCTGKCRERQLADRFFSPAEAQRLRQYSDAEAASYFYTLWTRKEAYGKLTGAGVAAQLVVPTDERDGAEWLSADAPEGYRVAVCRYLKEAWER